ncbi:hypothetical protein RI129_012822 [Pyrocoelia pectoralis]|uniref:THAP-type domain-containing protein n=1 Tax=Pyrocoelia pectoralis TaxID=417401 RepID=A0AAN7ZCF9_9COLE
MPGCSAVNCSNSTAKGFVMKRFPRDVKRRKQWLFKTRRENWIPTDHSYLCEIHFAPEMWEKTREDGSRKLKATAVPTIFSFTNPKRTRNALPPKEVKMSVSVISKYLYFHNIIISVCYLGFSAIQFNLIL